MRNSAIYHVDVHAHIIVFSIVPDLFVSKIDQNSYKGEDMFFSRFLNPSLKSVTNTVVLIFLIVQIGALIKIYKV